MTSLCTPDVVLGTGAHVRCMGKGRKERCTPLTKQAVNTLKRWLREPRRSAGDILFPNARGARLSADGVQFLLAKYVAAARQKCPSLKSKRVTPHVLRHTAAMELLQGGVDRSVIALWLGHDLPILRASSASASACRRRAHVVHGCSGSHSFPWR